MEQNCFLEWVSNNWAHNKTMEWTMSIVNFTAPLTFTISYQVRHLDQSPFMFVDGKMK